MHFSGEGDAQAAVAVPQRGLRLLLGQPDRAGVDDEAVLNQGKVAEFNFAVLGRTMKTVPLNPLKARNVHERHF